MSKHSMGMETQRLSVVPGGQRVSSFSLTRIGTGTKYELSICTERALAMGKSDPQGFAGMVEG